MLYPLGHVTSSIPLSTQRHLTNTSQPTTAPTTSHLSPPPRSHPPLPSFTSANTSDHSLRRPRPPTSQPPLHPLPPYLPPFSAHLPLSSLLPPSSPLHPRPRPHPSTPHHPAPSLHHSPPTAATLRHLNLPSLHQWGSSPRKMQLLLRREVLIPLGVQGRLSGNEFQAY